MLADGRRVIRYGDDFAILVSSPTLEEKALGGGTNLVDLRLELNSYKCHVAAFGGEGVDLERSPNGR